VDFCAIRSAKSRAIEKAFARDETSQCLPVVSSLRRLFILRKRLPVRRE
jgi:hypothetical protein